MHRRGRGIVNDDDDEVLIGYLFELNARSRFVVIAETVCLSFFPPDVNP